MTDGNRRCVFCNSSGALTKEHVFPQWIWRQHGVGQPPSKYVDAGPARFAETYLMDGEGPAAQILEPVNSKPILHATGIIVRSVCQSCNNGWMSVLEVRMAEVLHLLKSGRTWRPTVNELALVIRWTVKTVALLECAEPEIQLIPEEVFRAIREGSDAPGSWYLGLARVPKAAGFDMKSSPLHRSSVSADSPSTTLDGATRFASGYLLMLADLLIIVRYSPYEVRPPARLDHDLVKHRRGRPVTLAASTAGRPIKMKSLPLLSEDDIEDFAYWGHPRSAHGAMTLLGNGSQQWIGPLLTADPAHLAHGAADYELVDVRFTSLDDF